ncbi:hypothetical protein VO64_5862 [Pseudomonas synxantha]|uniref:Uncharacterized protein n=1 Tax=Pseudomonas synxantha TaxID=47883 RepID=A0AAU8TP24_9PSED|nr:hypothetical protein VO64_0014 [Pseudomonas synxantha]AKA82676.1 hypothetical protein VO64_2130 [Pseudomonas synxantha]AKA82937.1 hypothetical protein VO64_2391 [Pseudomonas synxantha]AKA84683.1 hypothetical protein VO64_4137 [Pseudomonas synxantha]AKA86408.1 hypothetical protein VO64_5862 [Pseudomonas synxantha]
MSGVPLKQVTRGYFMSVMLPKTFPILGCILQKMMEAMSSDFFGIH